MLELKDKIKTSWEIREWVEESIPEERDYIDWAEAHCDRWGKEWDELHSRDSTKWVSLSVLKKRDIKFMIDLNRAIKDNERYLGYRVKQIIGEHLKSLEE